MCGTIAALDLCFRGQRLWTMSSLNIVARNSKVFAAQICRNQQFGASNRHASSSAKVGFVGLGNMGGHMARNLMKNGHPLIVFDTVPDSMQAIKKEGATLASSPQEVASTVLLEQLASVLTGATLASSPQEVASQTNLIITMLPASQHVLDVYTGSSGILGSVQKGSLLIDSSTIDPSVSQQMAEESTKVGATFVDAPVSGGVNAARDAGLTFMVGSPDQSFGKVKEILDKMGKNVVHCGSVGTGQAAKICNNMLLAISMIGTAETMNLGMKLGLDPKLLAKILNMSSGRCWSSEVYNPVPGVLDGVPSSNDYQGGFGTALMTKDLGLAQNAATATQSPTPLGSLSHQLYRLMTNSGYAGKDFSSAFQFLKQQDKK
ncbi:3-hydroxyisobutyrate dehydrogenase, mitochondrial-like isoform X1 [Littorina saxatilis]